MVMHEHCDREYKEGIPLWSEHTLETLQLLHPDEDVGWGFNGANKLFNVSCSCNTEV